MALQGVCVCVSMYGCVCVCVCLCSIFIYIYSNSSNLGGTFRFPGSEAETNRMKSSIGNDGFLNSQWSFDRGWRRRQKRTTFFFRENDKICTPRCLVHQEVVIDSRFLLKVYMGGKNTSILLPSPAMMYKKNLRKIGREGGNCVMKGTQVCLEACWGKGDLHMSLTKIDS